MIKWVHFVTFIGISIIISCEAKSPKRQTTDNSKGDGNEGGCNKYPKCGVNEVYDVCPRLCPAQRCGVDERIIRCAKNPEPGDPECKPGCRCIDNYYRNNDGVCVTKDECPICLQKNEVYACRSSNPQTCETIDDESEPLKKTKHCKRECRCKEGFYRNKIGECISRDNCLQCNGPHEYFSCGSACDNVCDTIHLQNQTNCPIQNIVCNPMCYCEFGYARDHNNICVPIAECPPKCNRPNEVYKCQSPCPQTCDTIGEKCLSKHISKRDCKRECRCKKGFYRNTVGECISEENCLKCTGPHEYFSCGGYCDNVCATLKIQNQTNCPIKTYVCNPKCYCEDGYARDDNNICIPISDCPPTCGINEVYDICPRLCPSQKCGVDKRLIRCSRNPEPGDPRCKPGCRCADNYYRNNDGVCVTEKECPKCRRKNEVYACRSSNPQTCETIDEDYGPIKKTKHCKRECRCKPGFYRNKIGECISKKNCLKCNGPHEYFTCGSACDNVCDTIYLQNQTNCPVQNIVCNPMCYCEAGYARDHNNICVPIAECPPKCNRLNEVYECQNPCAQTCDTIGEKCLSKHISKGDCKRECRCKKGFYRNKLGDCISEENCLKCSGPHEFFSCGGACDNVCATLHIQNQTNCPIVNIVCNQKCYCENGYARNENNICVPIADCPPTCGVNEVYDICPRLCPLRRCDVDKQIFFCPRSPQPGDPGCKPGCRCADNYYRNNDGVCVTKKDCPKCRRKNEVYACRSSNPQTCETIDEDYGPIKETKHCKRECRCKPGFYRNKIGECISKKECLKCNGQNEYFSCDSACDNVCATLHLQNKTNCPIINKVCNKKCYCEEGYARDENNICVPIEECPPPAPTCDANEELSDCANAGCRRWKCSDKGIICYDVYEDSCVKGCVCKESYTQADNGTCILEDQCPPKCRGKDEVYACRSSNPQTCETIDKNYGPIKETKDCKRECRCKPGFYRNKIGECISKKECLKCNGQNEYFSCGSACDNVCATLHLQNKTNCPIINKVCKKKCYCEEGYARDENNICVPIEECPPICGVNEVYDICPSFCPPRRCDVDERLIKCRQYPLPGDPECEPGCRCVDNFYRNELEICVTRNECPPLIQCGENEYPSRCANGGCQKRSCAFPEIICVKLAEGACKEGCLCKENFLRDDNGTCIPEDECPPPAPTCDANEELSDCANGGCRRWKCSDEGTICNDVFEDSCVKGCACKESYTRADNGTCIPEDQCPPTCGINEVYDICPPICPPLRCNVNIAAISCKPSPIPGDPECNPGCRCADNHVRNDFNICIPREECPREPTCGENEEVSDCANGGCRQWKCSDEGIICYDLPEELCIKDCVCINSYVRSDNGTCIPKEQCPPPIQCGLNEKYSSCANGGCRRYSCAMSGILCVDLIEGACNPGCICKDSYTRADNGMCIPEDQCPPICPENEVYDICPELCPPHRCDIDESTIDCAPNPSPGDPDCEPGCRCIDNYYRNNLEVCVPKEECPPFIECGQNEHPSRCANGGCRKVSCERPTIRCVKLREGGCKEGCLCNDNYLRADNGTCIPEKECPPNEPICDINEEFSDCANSGCRRWKCSDRSQICKDVVKGGCKKGCVCKKSYTRADNGSCIPEKQCPKICGLNEEYRCNNTCNKACNIIDGKCVPPNNSKICKLQCYCKDGYKRNKKGKCVSACDDVTEKTTDGLTAFEQGNIAFTEQFLITASKNNPGSSLIGSPFSVLFLLAQLALYATGTAKTQLLDLLHLSDDCEIRSIVPKYFKLISETNNASFDLAEKIYGNDQYPFSKNFKKDSQDVFYAGAQNVDFSKSEEAANIINEWVAKQTKNLIKNLISPDSLSADTRLVLAIAIYFKGDWQHQFKARNTKSLPFYAGEKGNNEVQVQMMNQVGTFKYAEIDGVQVLQMPYKVSDISFVACLPKSKKGLKKLIKKLKKSSFIKRTLTELKRTEVDVSIPKLDISTTTDLKQVLSDAGVNAIFDPSTAGLSGILENPEDIFVTSAIQKAKLLLNETGTEAAAATAVTVTAYSAIVPEIPPIKFNADHPFIYYILCKKLPVFAGIYIAITVSITSVGVQEILPVKFNADHPFIYYIVYNKIPVFAGTYVSP